ncbi:MAG: Xaa-Pro peptidase family protein [Spirochaetaceae bacterium]|jgi:Xaa-Pro dipeptidase|nr:Xaa-Pro peptidase family protein [Spirochaetaceae bacterium]
MNKEQHQRRLQKTRERMEHEGVDVFFVSPSPNLRYLSGYSLPGDERLFLLVLPVRGEPFALVNALYRAQADVMPVPEFLLWSDGEDPFATLTAALKTRGVAVQKAALEPSLPALFSVPLSGAFPETEFILGSLLMDPQRQYKDDAELDLIRRASLLADRILGGLVSRGRYWIGKTEKDFALKLAACMREAGFETSGSIVAVGADAAVPHHVTGNAVIQPGKGLLIDFWGSLEGYFTDCSRTFFVGEPEKEFETVHGIVLEAHLAAEAKARPGNLLGDVDAAARSVIEGYGYGGYFTHRTGHGIGMESHEGASAAPGEQTPVKPGMVFSIEPGIYLPGKLGVRIENLVAVGEDGPEVLHQYPRELRSL